jgi:hypothetical protein
LRDDPQDSREVTTSTTSDNILLNGYDDGQACLIDNLSGRVIFSTEKTGVAVTSVEIAKNVFVVG